MSFDATGVMPAIVTPRKASGQVALERIKPIVDFLLSKGVDGLHVCGTTGEFATLTVDDRKRVLEECIKAAAGRGTIIAQVGAVATRDVCELAEHAGQVGADAVSSVPPFYYPVTVPIVMSHYRAIAESSRLPVVIYDNPLTTGVTVTPDVARELAQAGYVHGIKVARADMYALARFAEINNARFAVYPVETFYLSGLVTANVAGTIGSMGNWIPEVFVGIKLNFQRGNLGRAAELQRLVCELINAYPGEEMACTKALLARRGIPCGDPWRPLLPLTEQEKRALFKAIDSLVSDYESLAEVSE